jgi:nitrite reductase (NO-forming)
VIDATGGTPELEAERLEHHNIPATASPTDPQTLLGKTMFDTRCLACHTIGKGPAVGPDLQGVMSRRSEAWVTRWLLSPEKMLAEDDTAKALLARYQVPMPNQNLTHDDIRRLIQYFRWTGENAPPAGSDTSGAKQAL